MGTEALVAITLIINISSTLPTRSNQLREEDSGQYSQLLDGLTCAEFMNA